MVDRIHVRLYKVRTNNSGTIREKLPTLTIISIIWNACTCIRIDINHENKTVVDALGFPYLHVYIYICCIFTSYGKF